MYNRYIPQSDGSYRKNRVPEQHPPASSVPQQNSAPVHHAPVRNPDRGGSVTGFLRSILPREFDTGDLLVVLLLLLMAEHCDEDKNTALLTLALYFFM